MKKLGLMVAMSFVLCCPLAQAQTTESIASGNCKKVSDTCQKTLDYCNLQAGKFGKADVTNKLKDCITACDATEKFLTRGSSLQKKAAALTIEACNSVAKSCDQFPSDTKMQGCANEARKCASNLQKITTM